MCAAAYATVLSERSARDMLDRVLCLGMDAPHVYKGYFLGAKKVSSCCFSCLAAEHDSLSTQVMCWQCRAGCSRCSVRKRSHCECATPQLLSQYSIKVLTMVFQKSNLLFVLFGVHFPSFSFPLLNSLTLQLPLSNLQNSASGTECHSSLRALSQDCMLTARTGTVQMSVQTGNKQCTSLQCNALHCRLLH